MKVNFKPRVAAISPARTSFRSSRRSACIRSSRPMRSFRSLEAVYHIRTRFENAGVDSEVSQTADIGIGYYFEYQCCQRFIILGWSGFRFAILRVNTRNWRNILRRRQIINDRIPSLFEYLLLRRADPHRTGITILLMVALPQCIAQFLDRNLLAI